MKNITLIFTIDQANLALSALAKMPYEQSAALIGEIQRQAAPQLEEKTSPPIVESNGTQQE